MTTTEVLEQVAQNSTHPITRIGALIACKNTGKILAVGYNQRKPGPPRERVIPSVNPDYIHAEQFAINQAKSLNICGSDVKIICSWYPCVSCINSILEFGIEEVEYQTLSIHPSSWYYGNDSKLTIKVHEPYDIFDLY